MLITDPIPLGSAPDRQATLAIAPGDEVPRIALPDTSAAPIAIIAQLSAPRSADLRVGIRLPDTVTAAADDHEVIGFNGAPVQLSSEMVTVDDDEIQYLFAPVADTDKLVAASGQIMVLMETRPAPTGFTAGTGHFALYEAGEDSVSVEWIVAARVLVCAYPTPALRARVVRPRTTVTSITGRQWVTTRTDEPVMERMRIPLNNEYRENLPGELAQLDQFTQFTVWPAGIERVFRDTPDVIIHRRHDFARVAAISTWSGWRGHSDIDIHGATGEMTLSEIPWPGGVETPEITRRPTIPNIPPPPPSTAVAPPHGSQEQPMRWDGGVPADWAPDTPGGWQDPDPDDGS